MRHIVLSGTVAPAAIGMLEAAAMAILIAPARRPDRGAPRLRGTSAGAIDLPAVAMAAYEHLRAAARA